MVFFSSDGRENFSGNAMPNFIPDSNFPIIKLSNDVSFIPVPNLKHGQNSQNVKLVPWGVPKFILLSVCKHQAMASLLPFRKYCQFSPTSDFCHDQNPLFLYLFIM